MKYEAVFGDQSLFDGCYDENASIVIATSNGRKFVIGEFTEYGIVEGDVKSDGLRIAMRRIIAEPKRWTLEDQKAGRLPTVDSIVIWCNGSNTAGTNGAVYPEIGTQVLILAETDNSNLSKRGVVFKWITKDGILTSFTTRANDFYPIETPEEKAQREEDEFISSLSGADIQDGTVKDFFAQGARAAYRKLKGGE